MTAAPLLCQVMPWALSPLKFIAVSQPLLYTIICGRAAAIGGAASINSYRTSPRSIRDLRDAKARGCSVPSAARSLERMDHWTSPITDLDYSNGCCDVRSVQTKHEDDESAIANEYLDARVRQRLNEGKLRTLYLLLWSLYFTLEQVLHRSFRSYVSVALLFVSIFVRQLLRYSLGCGQLPLGTAVAYIVVTPI